MSSPTEGGEGHKNHFSLTMINILSSEANDAISGYFLDYPQKCLARWWADGNDHDSVRR